MIDRVNEKFILIPGKLDIDKENKAMYERLNCEMKAYVKRKIENVKDLV
jgi:hypothetical protein